MSQLMDVLLADQRQLGARIAAHTVQATTLAERQFDVRAALASLTVPSSLPKSVVDAIDRDCDEDARDQFYEAASDAAIALKHVVRACDYAAESEAVTTVIDTVRDLLECCLQARQADKAALLSIANVAMQLSMEAQQ